MGRTDTKMPNIFGCNSKDAARNIPFVGKKRAHQWNYSRSWNGNSKKVLPFHTGTTGIPRSGWRCYHCGAWRWDESDEIYALHFAYRMGLLPDFKRLMEGTEMRIQYQSSEAHTRAALVSNDRKHANDRAK